MFTNSNLNNNSKETLEKSFNCNDDDQLELFTDSIASDIYRKETPEDSLSFNNSSFEMFTDSNFNSNFKGTPKKSFNSDNDDDKEEWFNDTIINNSVTNETSKISLSGDNLTCTTIADEDDNQSIFKLNNASKTIQNSMTKYLKGYKSIIKMVSTSPENGKLNGKISLKMKNGKRKAEVAQQLMLDFGQKNLSLKQCKVCQMMYNSNQKEDVVLHNKYHQRMTTPLIYNKVKVDNMVEDYHNGNGIIMIQFDDKNALKRFDKIINIIENDFGFQINYESNENPFKIFFYIFNKQVISICLAEVPKNARLISESGVCPTSSKNNVHFLRCGINKIWVHEKHRRKKIATKMLGAVCSNFIFGCALDPFDLGFCKPTEDGAKLATAFTGNKSPMFYE